MAKAKNLKNPKASKETFFSKFDLEEILPQKYHILAVILVIIILFLIFLNPLFFGNKTFQSGDIVTSKSMETYLHADREGYTLWNPYIFGGMPAYAMATSFKWFNLIEVGMYSAVQVFSAFFEVDYANWALRLIILAITTFFLMRFFTKNILICLLAAIAAAFSTGLIVFLYIGHVTKLTSLCFYPLIFLMLLRFQEKIRLIDFVILIIALQLFVQGWHVQIIFYTIFAVGIYYIYYFVRALIKKDIFFIKQLLKSAGTFSLALIIALLIQMDNFTQIYEYTPFSTRGTESIVEKSKDDGLQSESEYYEYHTNWSFSPEEVLTFIVPSFYGFGNSKYKGPLTQGQEIEVNTYFGQMPFVDVAMYMGVVIFFLGLFAIYAMWKEPFVQFLTILAGISLLISFGKNFPIIYDLLFYNLPYFDKFRVPSMILVLVQMTFPILAGLGIMKIISLRNEPDQKIIKVVKNVSIIFALIFGLSILLSSAINSWFTERAQAGLQQQLKVLADYAAEMFTTDLILAFLFLAISFGAAHFYINKKISSALLAVIIILVTVTDLWRIDARGAKYHDVPEMENSFIEPEHIKVIKGRNDLQPFRILNIKQDGNLGSLNNNSNFHVAFLIEDLYGYSGIKPRSYQDIMDIVGSPVNPTLWRMLNVKYIVTPQAINFPGFNLLQNTQSGIVYENLNALPRAYFVDSVAGKNPLEILNSIKDNQFDPKRVAFVEEVNSISIDKPDSTAFVNISVYNDEEIILETLASGNNFLFLGDTYISGKADYKIFDLPTGWRAYINGNEKEIYRTNHGFMGIVVPEGRHKVEFIYSPISFKISKYVSLILSSLTIVLLGVGIFLNKKKYS